MFVSTRQEKKTVMKRFVVRTGFEPVMSNLKGLGTMPHYAPDLPLS